MEILVLGGDKRYESMMIELSKKNNIVAVGYGHRLPNITYEKIIDIDPIEFDIIIFPIKGINDYGYIDAEIPFKLNKYFFYRCRKDTQFFSGVESKFLNKNIENVENINYFMKDKNIVKENVIPTVEGIISDIISNTDITIDKSNIMVIGYGNIGKILTDYLVKMNSNIVVSIININEESILKEKNINYIYSNNKEQMNNNLNKMDVVVNTAPSLVLNDEYISNISQDAYVLDVSSYPYGVDEQSLKNHKTKYHIYPGIPGKIAPKTSGIILSKKINSVIGGFNK